MLKGLNPILGPELLSTLRAMGHGDEIAIVDGNYPAVAHAHRLIRADGHMVQRRFLMPSFRSCPSMTSCRKAFSFRIMTNASLPCRLQRNLRPARACGR